MKVLLVNALFPTPDDQRAIGGAETFAVRLTRGLRAAGTEVSVVRSGRSRSAGHCRTEDGLSVDSLPCRNIYPMSDGRRHLPTTRLAWHLIEDLGRISSAFARVLERERPDVVHTNNVVGMSTDLWRVARAAGVAIVHTLHDYYLTCPKVSRFRNGSCCGQTCASCDVLSRKRRQATRYVDFVVGVSQRMLDIHHEEGLFLKTPSAVVLNAPPRRAGPAVSAPPTARTDGRPVFGFIGRQALEKGIFDLLAAFCRLPAGAAKLLVAGAVDPAVGAWVERNAPPGADIEFTGFIAPADFFPRLDVAVFPSLWEEPCSMGIGEAFSFGVPVVGSIRGGTPELLEGGRLGWLYQPGPGVLDALLAKLVDDLEAIAAKAAVVRARPAPAGDPLVDAYRAIFERVRETAAPLAVRA